MIQHIFFIYKKANQFFKPKSVPNQNTPLGIGNCLVLLLLFLLGTPAFAQINTQTIRGKVLDKDSREALLGVNITLLNTDLGTTSDEKGSFRFDDIKVGRYQVQFSYIGYESLLLTEVLLESGKETVLEIALQEASNDLETIEVRASASNLNRNDIPLGIHTLTIEETRRFPANFNDPTRLAVSLPGVVNNSDQANGLVIRGNSPTNMAWRLEGLEIVNPNHTNNAGTMSDRPTTSGGGVNILSAQLLGTSNFLKGPFPSNFGNSLSGVLDMRLRKGNDEKGEYTAEFGLIGIDLAAEGPFSKKTKASYLVNYRYSFVGILDALGVPLGDESIAYQDFTFNLNFPMKKGNLNVFGLLGASQNIFEAQRDTSLWEIQKDNQDINYENIMFASGAKLELNLNKRLRWNTALAFSSLEAKRQSDLVQDDLEVNNLFEYDKLEQQKTSFNTHFLYKYKAKHRFKYGLNAMFYQFENTSFIQFSETIASGSNEGILLQPYLNWQYLSGAWTANLGVQYNHFTLNGSQSIEPRASLKWDFRPKQYLALSYGLHSRLQDPQVYSSTITTNKDLDFTKAHHIGLSYTNYLNNRTRFSAEAYYQQLFDVPIVDAANRSFSVLNIIDDFILDPLENEGTGTNYGIELSLQRYIQGDFYYLINTTLYRSLYTGGDGVQRSTRFDGKYIFNSTLGKEWTKTKKAKDKTWGANARLTYLGAFRASPIDVAASQLNGYTTYEESRAFSLEQAAYFKLDLRFYFRKSKEKYSSTIALDLQNATNQKNVAFSYYDARQETIILKNQLGLIPNLSYRIQF